MQAYFNPTRRNIKKKNGVTSGGVHTFLLIVDLAFILLVDC
jgi:hypothetical protein